MANPPLDPLTQKFQTLANVGETRQPIVETVRPASVGGTNIVLNRFNDYHILGEIARGGMGVVYRARHVTLDRVVALKMILAGRLADAEEVDRFQTEAKAAALLQHPNIVAVFEVDAWEGQHYFTMEYIDGCSLSSRLASGPVSNVEAADLVRKIARAIHYAHKQGVVHRDLKPSNILIDLEGEPHVTDFGLAKRMGLKSDRTRTGAVLGTPCYMSPEQAEGKTDEIGPLSDVYSIGAIFYELLTGRPPFNAATALDTVWQVVHNDPAPPRILNPTVDHDLETICLKCLEKDPKNRYASAEALAEDLQRYQNGESILARGFNVLDRLTRMLERTQYASAFKPWAAMLMAMGLVIGIEHLFVFLLVVMEQPGRYILFARTTQFLLMALLFYRKRGDRLLPTTAVERELWSIWIGYFLTYVVIVGTSRLLLWNGFIQKPDDPPEHFPEILPYPFLSLASGFAFFIMGSNYWGRCYAIGIAFFVLGGLMTFNMLWSPLLFGLGWMIALFVLGSHLRTLGKEREKPPVVSSSQLPTVQLK